MATRLLEGAFKEPTELQVAVKKGENDEQELDFQEKDWPAYEGLLEEREAERRRRKEEEESKNKKLDFQTAGGVQETSGGGAPPPDAPSVKPANTGQV